MQGDACNIYPQCKQNLHNTVEPRNIFPIAQVFCPQCMHTAQVERAQAVGANNLIYHISNMGILLGSSVLDQCNLAVVPQLKTEKNRNWGKLT